MTELEVISQEENVTDVDLSEQMQESFLEYAYSVIYSRALPDARDGLKPVQRRILYTMSQMGLLPSKGHVKSARVTGEVMGKLHPHGDASIYDTMVRMAQDFTMRLPLVDGHGNFGSLDDGPAASRYTEARMSAAALAMVNDLNHDVVDFVPNYDNQLMQPAVLPAAIPNLLVNGASGIAVGMATNIPPHNLRETAAAAIHLLRHPEADLDEIMQHLPGPDFPSGGTIVGLEGIREAYETGRGSFKMRAKITIDYTSPRRTNLVVTELPYLVGPERVIEKIKSGVNSRKINGVSSVTDLSDRKNGLRLVIGVKTGFTLNEVIEELYRHTPLEESFSVNSVALVGGAPKTLGLIEILQVFVDHRAEVITRRSRFHLEACLRRLHLVDGLLIAIVDIDRVIAIVRGSDDADSARAALMSELDISTEQAEYILQLRLRRLTRLSTLELEAEQKDLQERIAALRELLADRDKINAVIIEELQAAADELGDGRRTVLSSAALTKIKVEADYVCQVILTAKGDLLTSKQSEELLEAETTETLAVSSVVLSRIKSPVGMLTSLGRVITFAPSSLPQAEPSVSNAGVNAADFLSLEKGEKALTLVKLEPEETLSLGTKQGVVKRVTPAAWPEKPEIPVIALADDDEVVGAVHDTTDDDELVFITRQGQLLRYSATLVNPQGRSARGMAGIKLAKDDEVIFFGAVRDTAAARVVTVTDSNRLKVSEFADYPPKGRATGGVRSHAFLKEDTRLVAAIAAVSPVALNTQDRIIDLPTEIARRDASGTPQNYTVKTLGVPHRL